MRRFGLIGFLFISLLFARHDGPGCGTSRDTTAERLFLHRQAQRAHTGRVNARAVSAAPADRDLGDIAIVEDSGGVVEKLNQFNLDGATVTFVPSATAAARYRFGSSTGSYDADAATRGTPIVALGDDDSRQLTLPFAFPFFGATYSTIFVNSDGNLTFVMPESGSTLRSIGRLTGGPPRIAPLFDDLDPSRVAGGVRYLSDGTRAVFTWSAVPEYSAGPLSAGLTFQVRLYRDGRIDFAYSGVSLSGAVVGIAPGNGQGGVNIVSFRNDPSAEYSSAIVERFGDTLDIDIVAVAQRFYQTHEDAYDYLVIYNNEDIGALTGALAYESTVRSFSTGHGVAPQDYGSQYGSGSRLRAVLNMGPLSLYPVDPGGVVPLRAASKDTPLTVLGHETGHLFNAFASIRDANDPASKLMLGFQGSHWSFLFNSEASLDEGEQILDRGAGTSPRFVTGAVTQGYSPLDQYLMGFRPLTDVPATFAVIGSGASPLAHPQSGVPLFGDRLDISVNDVIAAEGRRSPDSTVAQRRYRFAFILVVPAGSTPPDSQVQQVETYRQQFPAFFAKAASGNASADAILNRSLKLSVFPAAGVLTGASTNAEIRVQTPPRAALAIQLQTPGGYLKTAASVTIPAGATSATFGLTGLKSGVEELLAVPSDASYETAYARVQVADGSAVRLETVSGGVAGGVPTVVRLTDINGLPYPGMRISAATTGAGSPASAVTDQQGRASFTWTDSLTLTVESTGITASFGAATTPTIAAVVSAASSEPGISPGGIQTLYGAQLSGGQILLNGTAVPLLYLSDNQINFYVPAGLPLGKATLTLKTPSASVLYSVNVVEEQPGIFPGAILRAGTAINATTSPVRPGDFLEIYCTGLGPTRNAGGLAVTAVTPTVFVGTVPIKPVFSGLTPGYQGLYQINVKLPDTLAPGSYGVILSSGTAHSNEVAIQVQ